MTSVAEVGREIFDCNKYYCSIDEDKREHYCVVDQVLGLDDKGYTQSNHWEFKNLPTITKTHFHSIELNNLETYLDTPSSNFPSTTADQN